MRTLYLVWHWFLAPVLMALIAWTIQGCRTISEDEFGYEYRDDCVLSTPEFGDITVHLILQHGTESPHSAEEIANEIYTTMLDYSDIGNIMIGWERTWVIYVISDDSSLWQEYCGDNPNDLLAVLGCAYVSGDLFPALIHENESQIAMVDFRFGDPGRWRTVLTHETLHLLRWYDTYDPDHRHLDNELWNLVR